MKKANHNEMNAQWTQYEINSALEQIKQKKSLEEIAKRQNRSTTNVYCKLKYIAADMYYNQSIPFDMIEELTSIKKESIVISPVQSAPVASVDEVVINILASPNLNPSIPTYSISNESPFTLDTFYKEVSTPVLKTIVSTINTILH